MFSTWEEMLQVAESSLHKAFLYIFFYLELLYILNF